MFNLGVKDKYEEALRQLGYDLETLAEQVRTKAGYPLVIPSRQEKTGVVAVSHPVPLVPNDKVNFSGLLGDVVEMSSPYLYANTSASFASVGCSRLLKLQPNSKLITHHLAGARCCTWQWRSWAVGSVLPGFHGHPQLSGLGVSSTREDQILTRTGKQFDAGCRPTLL